MPNLTLATRYKHTCEDHSAICLKCRADKLVKMGVTPKVIVQHLSYSVIQDTSLHNNMRRVIIKPHRKADDVI